MLWLSTSLIGGAIEARDGAIGSISDLLFDTADWTVRWAVADTGRWLPGRKVLLPPSCLVPPVAGGEAFRTDLTMQQVKDSPGIERDAPVSRQYESEVYGHYGWTPYWYPGYGAMPANMVPMAGIPPFAPPGPRGGAREAPEGMREPPQVPQGDPHLRSMSEVSGYHVAASDGDIGHVEDFMVEEATWAVRYVLVDTRNWWPGRKVLVATTWFRDVSWHERRIHVDLTREQVERSPEYDPAVSLGRTEEERLYGHYARAPYWL
jgi:hypothetical protein